DVLAPRRRRQRAGGINRANPCLALRLLLPPNDNSTARCLPVVSAREVGRRPPEPLRNPHDAREPDRRPGREVRQHAFLEPRQLGCNLPPSEPALAARFV